MELLEEPLEYVDGGIPTAMFVPGKPCILNEGVYKINYVTHIRHIDPDIPSFELLGKYTQDVVDTMKSVTKDVCFSIPIMNSVENVTNDCETFKLCEIFELNSWVTTLR